MVARMICKFVLFIVTICALLVFLIYYLPKNDRLPDPIVDQKLFVLSMDGFRYSYMNAELTPNLYRLASKEGVTGHMIATFPTKTFPNHHSIATGLYQETHGIVNNVMWDDTIGEVFNPRYSEMLSNDWWDNHKSTPLYIANQMHAKGRASACAPWVGCHARYFDLHTVKHERKYDKDSTPYEQFDWALEKMTQKEQPATLVMMYVQFPDAFGHKYGPFGNKTLSKVREMDQLIEHIRAKFFERGLDLTTNLICLSDHGMAEISSERITILETLCDNSTYDAYGSTPIMHIRPKAGYEKAVQETFASKQAEGHFKMYLKENIPSRYHYRAHHRIQPIVLVAEEGWSIYPTIEQAKMWQDNLGQHGYDNQADSMRPLFAAVGPAFKKGYNHTTQFVNVDLYPLMLTLLGIPHDAYFHEGDFQKVRDLLRS